MRAIFWEGHFNPVATLPSANIILLFFFHCTPKTNTPQQRSIVGRCITINCHNYSIECACKMHCYGSLYGFVFLSKQRLETRAQNIFNPREQKGKERTWFIAERVVKWKKRSNLWPHICLKHFQKFAKHPKSQKQVSKEESVKNWVAHTSRLAAVCLVGKNVSSFTQLKSYLELDTFIAVWSLRYVCGFGSCASNKTSAKWPYLMPSVSTQQVP